MVVIVLNRGFESWTVHSYEGDYNPLHDCGCQTNWTINDILFKSDKMY